MPKYLFTSDQRISHLSSRIQWVANYIQTGNSISSIDNKSDNNNATTLSFYYNLYENTEICKEASVDPIKAIRNFIMKFQFPNTRTPVSLNDSLSEGAFLAPYRVVVGLLYKMAEKSLTKYSTLSLNEILYFIFCNSKVFKNPYFSYDSLISEIENARNKSIDLEPLIAQEIEWNQYERQCRELMTILSIGSSVFQFKNKVFSFDLKSALVGPDAGFIKDILNYNKYWIPSDKSNFKLANLEYISYMDTSNIPYTVIEIDNKQQAINTPLNYPLQQISYGAPGTGKSHGVDFIIKKFHVNNTRTTFHPDSDYSTFVGAYKPTMEKFSKNVRMNLSVEDLAQKLGTYYNDSQLGKINGIQKFCLDFYPYIDGEYMSVNVDKLVELSGVPNTYNVEIEKYLKFCRILPKQEEKKIVYSFVPQAFLKAYTTAWKQFPEPYILVIEEINRGNCAQIFGDLFQLLDRDDNGYSKYPISSDNDIQKFLQENEKYGFANLTEEQKANFPYESILNGEELLLPPNLYIWATMNTSDQSLFPIDSAFKRRWDWKYVPIAKGRDKNGKDLNWTLEIGTHKYSWWSVIDNINNKIVDKLTSSQDKKLGYFFCKAKDGVITESVFVEKVLFFLWNEVLKDYEQEQDFLKDNDGNYLKFESFYSENEIGEIQLATDKIITLLNNLKVEDWKDIEANNDRDAQNIKTDTDDNHNSIE